MQFYGIFLVYACTLFFMTGCGADGNQSPSDAGLDAAEAGFEGGMDSDTDTDSDSDSDNDSDNDSDSDSDAGPGGSMGPGTDNEYDPDPSNSDGVDTDDDGWLVLDEEAFVLKYLWIANSADGTVSKIDTEEVLEVGRYAVGLAEDRSDPSRTSVDLIGDVFIANRNTDYGTLGPSSITKIAAEDEMCVDRNGNSSIETSSGTDVLARSTGGGSVPDGQSTDECVLWTRGFDSLDPDPLETDYGCYGMRGVAATAETGTNFEYNGHVWIGCYGSREESGNVLGGRAVYKLNGNTGDLMEQYQFSGCHPYGFLLDRDDRLWISCRDGWGWSADEGVAWMDTGNGNDTFMPDEPGLQDGPNPYGIALDSDGNVWITKYDGYIAKYTPGSNQNLDNGTWEFLKVTDSFRGIAVDRDGFVWAIDTTDDSVIYLINPAEFPEDTAIVDSYYLGDDDVDGGVVHAHNGVGVAIDFDGNVWGVSRNGGDDNGYATRLEVDRSDSLPAVVAKDIIPVGKEPYSYSDMIGYHLRNFTTKEGWYRQRFEVCPGQSTKWEKISWDIETPADTSVILRARTADYAGDLPSAVWHMTAEIPPDTSPKDLPAALPEGHFIAIEIRMYTEQDGVTPRVGPISFTYECTTDLE